MYYYPLKPRVFFLACPWHFALRLLRSLISMKSSCTCFGPAQLGSKSTPPHQTQISDQSSPLLHWCPKDPCQARPQSQSNDLSQELCTNYARTKSDKKSPKQGTKTRSLTPLESHWKNQAQSHQPSLKKLLQLFFILLRNECSFRTENFLSK